MGLMVYNTLTRQLESFTPVNPPFVRIYLCGLTVYDYAHIGHARTYIAFDVIVRYLKFKQFFVQVVQNVTDVDDKMIKRAQQEGIDVLTLGKRFSAAAEQDFKALRIQFADYYPKATENITEMIKIIEVLITKGHAYRAGNDVYFDVASFLTYGRLSNRRIDAQTASGEPDEATIKRHPADFALWKAEKPGEIAWESPWGRGRPGWHIECTAMSTKYLGPQFDIHGGAQDLIFPHHENETAQTESYTGKTPWVKYWIHTGFLNIRGEKMSKSLGNFITIRDILKDWRPDAFRLLVLKSHYRSPIDFSEEKMIESTRQLEALEGLLQRIQSIMQSTTPESLVHLTSKEDQAFIAFLETEQIKFFDSMDSDFNTPEAIAVLFGISSEAQKYIRSPTPHPSVVNKLLDVFGLLLPVLGLFEVGQRSEDALVRGLIESLITVRKMAREQKNYALADLVRVKLTGLGIELQDHKEGTIWQRVLPK